jgi:hypothetical protein
MGRSVPNEPRRSVVKPNPSGLRRGGSVTLEEGASQEEIDNALREPAPAPEQESA